jgi:hypothetical protein
MSSCSPAATRRSRYANQEDVRAQGGFDFGNPAYALLFPLEIPAGQYLPCGDLGACGGGKFAGIPVTPYAPVYSRSREPSPRTSFGPQIVSWHSRTGRRRTARNPHATGAGPTYAYKLLIIHELLVFAGRMRFLRKLAEPIEAERQEQTRIGAAGPESPR